MLRNFSRIAFWFGGLMVLSKASVAPLQAEPAEHDLKPMLQILEAHCTDCHGSIKREGGIDLQRFSDPTIIDQERSLWKNIFNVVESGQMPLPQTGYELDESQRDRLLQFARTVLSRPDAQLKAIDPGKPVLRRLTRLEYNNTVRDLFRLDYDVFMFPERLPVSEKRYFTQSGSHLGAVVQTAMREYGQKYPVLLPHLGLPGENRAEHGFANRGDALNLSPLLFENYLEMAAAIANSEQLLRDSPVMQRLLGIHLAPQPAKVVTAQALELSPSFAPRQLIGTLAAENDLSYDKFVSELELASQSGLGGTFDIPPTLNNQTIAGKGGLIKLRVQQQVLTINPNIDLWCASFATANETSGELLLTNRQPGEKTFELTFAGAEAFEPRILQLGVCVLARRNQTGTVRLTAILSSGQPMERQAEISQASGNVFFSWVAPPGTEIRKLAIDGSNFSGDYVLLDDLGLITDAPWTLPKTQSAGSTTPTPRVAAENGPRTEGPAPVERRVAEFLERAYRRQITPEELQTAVALVNSQIATGTAEATAVRRLIQTVLSAPDFLYLAEPQSQAADTVRRLTPHELANRLSYFLWSSMPDEALMAVASSQEILEPAIMRAQVKRMLADRIHSRELSESFAAQWLRLDQLYTSKPDRELFPKFYSGPQGKATLHGPMLTEALLLFETVLVEDLSILELYDPNFTWLNQQLAQLYDLESAFSDSMHAASATGNMPSALPAKGGDAYWFRTNLPDRTRGGIMTMAGPLVLTSLPMRTSPIKRGAWLLETVFNRPPSEPKVAFVLEEVNSESKLSEATSPRSVRQQFEQHRNDPNCYSCHSRIDPPGFSLEVFDAIGSLRTHDGTQPVDASGKWNGMEFDGPAEFKESVLSHQQELVRGFVEHLLSYALGRKITHFDTHTVDHIVSETAAQNYRLSAIVEEIVLSYPFQFVRNVD